MTRLLACSFVAVALAAAAPAALASDSTLGLRVSLQTIQLGSDVARLKLARTPAQEAKASARLKVDAAKATRDVKAQRPTSALGARCKRAALSSYAQFAAAAKAFATGSQLRGRALTDSGLSKLETAARLAAKL
ncbi:MAG TPA: hypothetical protein VGF23_11100 [Gaiellaceae bacterium]